MAQWKLSSSVVRASATLCVILQVEYISRQISLDILFVGEEQAEQFDSLTQIMHWPDPKPDTTALSEINMKHDFGQSLARVFFNSTWNRIFRKICWWVV